MREASVGNAARAPHRSPLASNTLSNARTSKRGAKRCAHRQKEQSPPATQSSTTSPMKAAKLITALALLGLHGAAGDDLAPPPPPPSDDATAAPTAAPTVPGWFPGGDYSLATTQNHSCFGDATCPSAFQLGGGIKSSINASSIFLPNGERPRPSRRLLSMTAASMASSPLPHAVNAVDASSRESTAAASRRSRPAQASSN